MNFLNLKRRNRSLEANEIILKEISVMCDVNMLDEFNGFNTDGVFSIYE
jgi:hypothetical protein